MNNNLIEIRGMVEADFQSSALIMSQSFSSKMPLLKKHNEAEIAAFMLAGGLFDKSYLAGHYVAVIEGTVVGIMHLDTWQRHKRKPSPNKNLRFLFGKFGFLRVMLSGIGLAFFEDRLSKDEMYIDFIAIDAGHRGQGVGTMLLTFGEDLARKTNGIRRYTLGVIHENVRARQLYEKLGFRVYETKSSRVIELLTGVRTSHRLEKLL